jgi:hypothetical protein
MVALNSKFDILRGWPNSSAVAEDFISTSDDHKQGRWVTLSDNYTADTSLANAASGAEKSCYLIIEGKDDYSARFAKRVTCLVGGGYVVRIPETAPVLGGAGSSDTYRCFAAGKTAASFTVGQFASVVNGLLTNKTTKADGDVVGQILAVDVNGGTVDLLVI